jgi:hypothetical protein
MGVESLFADSDADKEAAQRVNSGIRARGNEDRRRSCSGW